MQSKKTLVYLILKWEGVGKRTRGGLSKGNKLVKGTIGGEAHKNGGQGSLSQVIGRPLKKRGTSEMDYTGRLGGAETATDSTANSAHIFIAMCRRRRKT